MATFTVKGWVRDYENLLCTREEDVDDVNEALDLADQWDRSGMYDVVFIDKEEA